MTVDYNKSTYNRKQTQFPGFYKLEKLEIENLDISDQVVQFDIYESLGPFFSLTAKLIIVDTTNILSHLPIKGGEKVLIIVNDEVKQEKYDFIVNSVTDRSMSSQGSMKYTLNLVTPEYFIDSYTRVSKSFINKKYEDVIKEMVEKWLKSRKNVLCASTIEDRCFLIPNWSPLKACAWMASRSQSSNQEYNGGNFMFFETQKGYNFLAVDNLLDDKHNYPYARVTYDPARLSVDKLLSYDSRTPRDTIRFEELYVIKSSDQIDNTISGMYANKIRFVDVTSKEPKDITWNYVEDFHKGKHLRGGIRNEAFPLIEKKHPALEHPDSFYKVVPRHKGLFTQEKDNGDHSPEWMSNRVSQIKQIEQFSLQGTLPGHLGMYTGMIVEFGYPDFRDRSIRTDYKDDPYWSGLYLVTAIRKSFRRDKFYLHIEIMRDAYALSLEQQKI